MVIGLAAWFVRWLLARQTPDNDVPDLETGFELVDPDPEAVVSELEAGLAEAAEHLRREGEPSDAVVAAWVALEAAALRSGVPRDPAATPTEFAVEVLDRTAADRTATRSLLAAYHRVRFSGLPVTVDDVERAAADLRQVAATIRPVQAEQMSADPVPRSRRRVAAAMDLARAGRLPAQRPAVVGGRGGGRAPGVLGRGAGARRAA